MDKILATHPNGTTIEFDESIHRYTTEKCDNFTSATTLIHKFFQPFDKQGISKRYGEKHGIPQFEVLKMWQRENDISTELGTMVHTFCEQKLLDQPYTIKPVTKKQRNVIKTADRAVEFLQQHFEFIDSEKIIFSEKYQIAGTIDLLMKRNDTLYILDWKTNKKIVTDNPYRKYGLYPIEHLADNNYTHYQLQLNLYKWLLLKEKYYDCNIEMKLIYLMENKFKVFPVNDLQNEIEDIVSVASNRDQW